jgi:hypothetical protein
MDFTEAQNLFAFFFAVYFALIIDRAHHTYTPWDTYGAWKGNVNNIYRLLAGWIILFIMPLLHFSLLFVLLGSIGTDFKMTAVDVLSLVLIGLGSFFDFGYYRIYEAFLHNYPGVFFSDEELAGMIASGKLRPGFRAHFIPGMLFVTLSTLLILTAVVLLA